MQRLSRTYLNETNQKYIALLSHYQEIRGILLKHLPPSTVTLFAQPELNLDNTVVSWYTDLEGQPYRLGESESDNKMLSIVQPIINQRVQAIYNLTKTLQSKNLITVEQIQWLNKLIDGLSHDTKEIYLINNEPVITAWGVGQKIVPPTPTPTPQLPVATPAKPHLCCWLLSLLLLLGAGLFWYWMEHHNVESALLVEPVAKVLEEPKSVVKEPKAEVPKIEEPKIEEPKIEEPKIEEPKVEEPKVEESKEKVLEKTEEVKPPVPVCKTEYQQETPQMVIIFDVSPSMETTLLESPQTIKEFEERLATIGVSDFEIEYMKRLPNRLSMAKKSSANIIDNIDKNVDIGLVTLRQCPSANNYGFYSPNKRNMLKNKIKKMQPDNSPNSGTPLYSGLKKASSMVDGIKRDAFILILSDGEHSCDSSNICSLANKLAQSKPKLKVNVVDIGGAQAANCVAYATGGEVFTANNPKQVTSMINQAVTPMTEITNCR